VLHDDGPTEAGFVLLNASKPPLNDQRVRRALAYATDRGRLADAAGWPRDRLRDSPFERPFVADDVHLPQYDPVRARQLVAEYRRATGRDIAFELSGPFDLAVLQHLSDQWAEVGIRVNVSVVDVHKAILSAVGGTYDALLFSYFGARDPDLVGTFWRTPDTGRPGLPLNLARVTDPALDAAFDAGRGSPDVTDRRRAYRVVQERLAELVPYIWLYRLDWIVASQSRVHDVRSVTMPDGTPAPPFNSGVFRFTETWVSD
jgi:peptide/nickel transport system substrate-binding protein